MSLKEIRLRDYKLLLIAMSGVRVQNQDLLALGLTLPGFVERSKVIAELPSLSLLTIASYCPSNWQIQYIEIDSLERKSFDWIKIQEFDLVAISSLTTRINDAYKICSNIRELGIPVVLGGLHASALPEEALRYADVVVQGEGEIVWPAIIRDLEARKLKAFYSSFSKKYRSPSFGLTKVPRYDLLDITTYNRIPVQTTRGCPIGCFFCGASRIISNYKKKTIECVENEIEAIMKCWSNPFIELADDNTFIDKEWSKQLVRMFSKYPLKWFSECDISVADDDRLLELLAQSNCAQLLIGLESPSAASLRGIDPQDWKMNQHESYIRKIEKIQSYGISVNGCFILGLDTHDKSIFDYTRTFIRECKLTEVQITILTPFPGTKLYQSLKSQGRLLKDKFWDECTLFDVTFRPAQMTPEELELGFYELMRDVYNYDEVKKRKRCFNQLKRDRNHFGRFHDDNIIIH